MTSRKFLKALLPFVVVGVSMAIANHMIDTRAEKKQPELREKIWQVDVIEASRQSLSPSITLYGRVESPEQLQAAAPGAGIVDQINVRQGDGAVKGDILVSMDRRDFETQRVQAESELSDLKSQMSELKIRHNANLALLETERELLKLAEADVVRMRKLKNQNLGSATTLSEALNSRGRQQLSLQNRQLDVDSFPAKLQMLEARQQQSRARLAEAKLRIERSTVIAPFHAIISSVPISVGDRVSVGQNLITLYPVHSLEIRAHIPHNYIADIQAAMINSEQLKAQIKGRQAGLEFKLIRLSGDAKATGIDAYFDTATISQSLRPGELLTLTLALSPEPGVLAIPYQAIYGNARIYVKRDNRLVGIDVETVGQFRAKNEAGTTGTRLLIRSELIKDDDFIVVTHLPNAITGLKVRTVKNDTSQ